MSLDSGLVPFLQTSVHRSVTTTHLGAWFPRLRRRRRLISVLHFQPFQPTHSLSPGRGNRKFSRLLPHSENIAFSPMAPEPPVREMLLFLCFFQVISLSHPLYSHPSAPTPPDSSVSRLCRCQGQENSMLSFTQNVKEGCLRPDPE